MATKELSLPFILSQVGACPADILGLFWISTGEDLRTGLLFWPASSVFIVLVWGMSSSWQSAGQSIVDLGPVLFQAYELRLRPSFAVLLGDTDWFLYSDSALSF